MKDKRSGSTTISTKQTLALQTRLQQIIAKNYSAIRRTRSDKTNISLQTRLRQLIASNYRATVESAQKDEDENTAMHKTISAHITTTNYSTDKQRETANRTQVLEGLPEFAVRNALKRKVLLCTHR